MIGASREFNDLVQAPGQTIVARVDVQQLGAIVRTLPIHSGQVEADRSNKTLRRFSCEVADPDGQLTPDNLRDLLMPFGTLLRPYRGLRIPIVDHAIDRDDTGPAWTAGERSGTRADPDSGDLILGYN